MCVIFFFVSANLGTGWWGQVSVPLLRHVIKHSSIETGDGGGGGGCDLFLMVFLSLCFGCGAFVVLLCVRVFVCFWLRPGKKLL